MTVVAFIPARSGSKRIPDKNLQHVGGKSLLQRAVNCAHAAGVDRIVVSSDAERVVASLDRQPPVELHLAGPPVHTDAAQIEGAIRHWLARAQMKEDDIVALCQCTSPNRRPKTVRRCVEWVTSGRHDVCVAVTRDVARVHFTGRIRGVYDKSASADVGYEVRWNNPPDYRPRSQDCRNDGVDRGTCWAFRVGHFRATGLRMAQRTGAVLVSKWEALDVDSPADLEAARVLAPHVERLIAEDA